MACELYLNKATVIKKSFLINIFLGDKRENISFENKNFIISS